MAHTITLRVVCLPCDRSSLRRGPHRPSGHCCPWVLSGGGSGDKSGTRGDKEACQAQAGMKGPLWRLVALGGHLGARLPWAARFPGFEAGRELGTHQGCHACSSQAWTWTSPPLFSRHSESKENRSAGCVWGHRGVAVACEVARVLEGRWRPGLSLRRSLPRGQLRESGNQTLCFSRWLRHRHPGLCGRPRLSAHCDCDCDLENLMPFCGLWGRTEPAALSPSRQPRAAPVGFGFLD